MTIPAGMCQCGCGRPTRVARQTDSGRGIVKGEPRRFLPGHNRRANPLLGPDNPRWNGGRRTDTGGYIYLLMPEHPNANAVGYVGEHVVVASRALGKALPEGAVVHHVDGDPTNNRNHNLVVCQDQSYHVFLEQQTRALRACGKADWRVCSECGQYDDPENLNRYGSKYVHRGGCAAHAEKDAA